MKDFKVYQTSGMLNFLVSEASDVRKKEQTLSGNVVSFDADEQTALKITADIVSETGATGCDIWHTGSNICGGERLKERLVYSMPTGTLDEDAKTFKFASNISAPYWVYSYHNYPFKENTRYTFIITCSKSSGTSTNMRVFYTDGTYTNLTDIPTTKTMNVFVSASGKTVDHFMKYTASGTTTLYYEESGIFEGVLTASDFEQYVDTHYPISWLTEAGTINAGDLTIDYDGSVTLETGGQTYTLTSISPIETYIGDNNIWTESGEVSVTYPI